MRRVDLVVEHGREGGEQGGGRGHGLEGGEQGGGRCAVRVGESEDRVRVRAGGRV